MTVYVKKLDLKNINYDGSEFFSYFVNTFDSPIDEVYALDQVNKLIDKIWSGYAYIFYLNEFFLYSSLFFIGNNLILNFFLFK